jgi:NTE family protein
MESNQRGLADQLGNLSVLHDAGAPPLLGYALAASVAWHTRAPVLLLVLGDALPPALAALAGAEGTALSVADSRARGELGAPRAVVLRAPLADDFAPRRLAPTVERLRRQYGHVLIQATGPVPALLAHQICLSGAGSTPSGPADAQPGHTLRAWVAGRVQPRPGSDGALSVPPLEAADESALQAGVLPTATPAGRALGWAARDLAGLKVGLALGAGGVKGYAHLGVVSALQRAGLPIDYLAGTSVGAVVAGLVALGHQPEAIARILDAGDCMLARPSFGLKSLLSDAPVRHYFRSISGRAHIEDLRVPLAIVAADILTRREVVFRRGLLWPATLASIAIPGVLPAQAIGPYRLVDGSIVNPVPADVAVGMGADVVIAIRLRAEPPPARAEVVAREPHGKAPSILEVLTRSVHAMQSRVAAEAESATTIVIEPRCAGAPEFGLRHFSWGRRYVEVGQAAAQEALPRLSAVLPWLQPAAASPSVPPA